MSVSISGCCSIFTANTRDRDGFAVGFYRQIAADSGQFQELGSEQQWTLFLSQACECSGIKEVESHLPPVSSPKTDLSETLASDPFFLWSTFFPEITSHFTFLTQNEKLLQINKSYSYTHSYMYVVYVCDIHTQ